MASFIAQLNDITEDIDVEVSLGEKKLLTSGVVFTDQGKPIHIKVADINITFIFEQDDSSKKTYFDVKAKDSSDVNPKDVIFSLINFNSPFGHGKIEPMSLIFTDNLTLYLSFFVVKIGKNNNTYQFSYSFFYGEKNG